MNENTESTLSHLEANDVLDVLDRSLFVDQLVEIANLLSDGRKNACYAINGEWGVGKSFVLNMFEHELAKQCGSVLPDKYIIFRYNCWAYDYYNEPVIAIVAALVDAIDENERMIPAEKSGKVKSVLKAFGAAIASGVADKVAEVIRSKSGVDINKLRQIAKEGLAAADNEWEIQHAYDPYFEFGKVLKGLKKVIGELTQDRTMLVIVDELDRCLPEYSIKVLERLHHVFDEVPNVQVLVAVDKLQLENIIKNTFGYRTHVDRYLAKFFDFELSLPCGEVSGSLREAYPYYFSCFDDKAVPQNDVDSFTHTILKGVEARAIGTIIEKSYLCHRLLWEEEQCCSSILCIEVFLTLLKHYGLKMEDAKAKFNVSELFTNNNMFVNYKGTLTGLAVLSGKYKRGYNGNLRYFSDQDGFSSINCADIYGLILGCYRIILGYTDDTWYYGNFKNDMVREYVHKYWKLLKAVH